MIQYIVRFTNGTETIVFATDGRDAWRVAVLKAAQTYRQVEDIRL